MGRALWHSRKEVRESTTGSMVNGFHHDTWLSYHTLFCLRWTFFSGGGKMRETTMIMMMTGGLCSFFRLDGLLVDRKIGSAQSLVIHHSGLAQAHCCFPHLESCSWSVVVIHIDGSNNRGQLLLESFIIRVTMTIQL